MKTKRLMTNWLFIFFLVLGSSAYAASPKLYMDVGGGQLNLHLEGLDISKEEIEKIERDLLIDEALASLVMDNNSLRIHIDFEKLEKKMGEELKESLKIVLQGHVKKDSSASTSFPANYTYAGEEGPDRVVMGSQLTVEKDEAYGDVAVFGGNVHVYGTIRELVIFGGSVQIYGAVKELAVFGGHIHVHNDGVIGEDLTLFGGHLEKAPGARVTGSVQNFSLGGGVIWPAINVLFFDSNVMNPFGWSWKWIFRVSFIPMFLLILYLCMFLFPSFHRRTQEALSEHLGQSLIFSFSYALLFVPLMLALILSVIGILFLPLLFAVSWIFVILGLGESALWLAHQVNKKLSWFSPEREFLLAFMGLIFLEVIALMPYVGPLVKMCFYIIGFGAVLLACYKTPLTRYSSLSSEVKGEGQPITT